MLQNTKKRTEGFTIIEVMIVLAIAGLIMLIVFLAVPALQRNSRNTALKNDAGNVLGGISDYQGNNNGSMPTTVSNPPGPDGSVNITGSGNTTTAKVRGGTVISMQSAAATSVTPAANGTLYVVMGSKCSGTIGANGGAAELTTNPRAAAVVYWTETSGSANATQCVDS